MRYLFELNHPKHYHQYKNLFYHLIKIGINPIVITRDKDIIINLNDKIQKE